MSAGALGSPGGHGVTCSRPAGRWEPPLWVLGTKQFSARAANALKHWATPHFLHFSHRFGKGDWRDEGLPSLEAAVCSSLGWDGVDREHEAGDHSAPTGSRRGACWGTIGLFIPGPKPLG